MVFKNKFPHYSMTSVDESYNITKYRYRVDTGTIEDHHEKMDRVLNEAGLLIAKDSFNYYITDSRKWLLAKIKYGF